MRTRVAIIGAGPAGPLLSHMLHLAGIDSVVLETRDRAYVEARQRAGVVEHGAAELLQRVGLGERMEREGIVHSGIELRFSGHSHRVDFTDLCGRTVRIWAQTEIVKDLVARRQADGGQILFGAQATAIEDAKGDRPKVHFVRKGSHQVLECDYVAACDGFHGNGGRSLPRQAVRTFDRLHPFSWLGVLADVAPSSDELIYARHERGFALHSLRSEHVSRLYLQVPNDTDPAQWSDERIWDELSERMALPGWELKQGPIIDKSLTPMRSFVTEPMSHGRLYLAGDTAHIVPPTGAKGLNLALNDVSLPAQAFIALYTHGDHEPLQEYSNTALRRVWRAEHFSAWMTHLLHTFEDAFENRLQHDHLEFLASSRAASTQLAENYTGIPHL